jgi:class I fructose-bisphosphate aldolase
VGIGKQIRLNRIFSHASGRACTLAVDHFVGYQKGLPQGLVNVPETIAKLVQGKPDAITMWKGMAQGAWGPYAGTIPMIISSISFTPDDAIMQQLTTPEEVVRLGGDAIAAAIGVRGPREGEYLKLLAGIVSEAARWDLPVMTHIYPRDYSDGARIVHDPEHIMWAVRCGVECGADIIKVPYTGDVASYREIVATSPVPVVAAGGPKTDTLEGALGLMAGVVEAGAVGATIGRNIWGAPDPLLAMHAFKAVIHTRMTPKEAIAHAESLRRAETEL